MTVVAVLAGPLLIGVASAAYQHAYAMWPWQSTPSWIHWCGRDYELQRGTQSLSEAETRAIPPWSEPWQHLGDVGLAPVTSSSFYGRPWSPETRAQRHLGACATSVYLQSSANQYAEYDLSGSP